ncbi:MAG: hypothetical protein GXP08_05155 [Gammaproteobacteria bacterium]|nr:hypothetical protein [Gammaproteobacteria bacterium]
MSMRPERCALGVRPLPCLEDETISGLQTLGHFVLTLKVKCKFTDNNASNSQGLMTIPDLYSAIMSSNYDQQL